jgi:hypothetical protein
MPSGQGISLPGRLTVPKRRANHEALERYQIGVIYGLRFLFYMPNGTPETLLTDTSE